MKTPQPRRRFCVKFGNRKWILISTVHMLSHRRLSQLIGMIYDCAIDSGRWPATLAEICQSIGCMSGFLLLVDLEHSSHKFAYSWGLSPDWKERYSAYSDQLTGFYSIA